MAQRIHPESEHEGRSVLGMLAVQVEKDPKTGATIVRSVTPVSGSPEPQSAHTIFDDGYKSIHAVGASAEQPSSEELGQILSVIEGVGLTALLDDVTITPTQEMLKVEVTKEVTKSGQGKVVSDDEGVPAVNTSKGPELVASDNQAMPSVNISKGPDFKEKDIFENVPKTIAATEVRQKTLVTDSSPKVEVTESELLCEGPVTLMFMGYADGEGLGAEEPQGMLTAERVIITDDGEELVIGRESVAPFQKPAEYTAAQKAPSQEPAEYMAAQKAPSQKTAENKVDQKAPSQKPAENKVDQKAPSQKPAENKVDQKAPSQKPAEDKVDQKAPKESQDKAEFQEVPLEWQEEQVPQKGDEGGNGQQKPESTAEGQGKLKRKTCQCCTVM